MVVSGQGLLTILRVMTDCSPNTLTDFLPSGQIDIDKLLLCLTAPIYLNVHITLGNSCEAPILHTLNLQLDPLVKMKLAVVLVMLITNLGWPFVRLW